MSNHYSETESFPVPSLDLKTQFRLWVQSKTSQQKCTVAVLLLYSYALVIVGVLKLATTKCEVVFEVW